jgi:lipoate-protein ligase B
MAELNVLDIGRRGYLQALKLQEKLRRDVAAAGGELAWLVLLEHEPPVITLGRSARSEHILAPREELARAGIEVHETTRGGDVTYHAPGQLVAYPIIRLDLHGRDVSAYLRSLEEVLIRLLRSFDIRARRREGLTGVWVGDGKIAAVGVAVRRWVTWHGLALNVCPDMSGFEKIVPCGIPNCDVTSMARVLGRRITVEQVKPGVIKYMLEVFGFERAVESNLEL